MSDKPHYYSNHNAAKNNFFGKQPKLGDIQNDVIKMATSKLKIYSYRQPNIQQKVNISSICMGKCREKKH